MANRGQIPSSNSALIAMIADEDTVVGFLLAGVGNVDLRRKTNYLVIDSKTTTKQIQDAFKECTTSVDIALVLISQYVANMVRFLVDSYNKPVPAILEIPSNMILLMIQFFHESSASSLPNPSHLIDAKKVFHRLLICMLMGRL